MKAALGARRAGTTGGDHDSLLTVDLFATQPEAGAPGVVHDLVLFASRFSMDGAVDAPMANGAVDARMANGAVETPMANSAPVFVAIGAGITRVSTDAAGAQTTGGGSYNLAFSRDGTKVAFTSGATNLVVGDTNGVEDVFVKDLASGAITRVSTDSAGGQGVGGSGGPVFSPDGTKVAFSSAASLVPGDTNGLADIFVKDLTTGAIARVSTNAAGGEATGGGSSAAVFSPDGTKILFWSSANNLVAGDTNGTAPDLFVKHLASGAITRVSTNAAGQQTTGGFNFPGVFSPDGTKVAFHSSATNLIAGDTNGAYDVFIKDLNSGAVTRASTNAAGAQATGNSIAAVFSPDGAKVAFMSDATNLVSGDTNGRFDLFVKDLTTGEITRVSTEAAGGQATGQSNAPVFSPDSTKLAFQSSADNLVPGDTNGLEDIFVKDLTTGAIARVSISAAGGQTTGGGSFYVAFSPDGATLAFNSDATNLVADDSNGATDIFIRELGSATATYTENGPAVAPARTVSISDSDSDNYAGGTLGAAITAGSVAGDQLTIASTGGSAGIDVVGNSVRYNNLEIGLLTATATSLSVALDADATDAAVEALAEAVRISSTSDDPTNATRTVTFTLVDGGGTAGGGADTASFTRDVAFVPVEDAGVAGADGGTVAENGTIVLTVLANDSDADGPAPSVARVNGVAIASGGSIVLPSGARVTRNGDGTLTYDTNGAFGATPAPGSGASNTPAIDTFTYSLAAGGTATVTMTVTGLDTNDTLLGTPGSDSLAGGVGDDIYFVDNAGDSVAELAGEGSDYVSARVSWTLTAGAQVETVSTFAHAATDAIDLTGNALANTLIGNAAANRLEGGGGIDRLLGLGGADVLIGGADADLLDGGSGNDLMEGRGGDDFYVIEDADDAIVELAAGGSDYVRARASWTLNAGAEVETVSTDSHAALTAIDLTGNALANTLIGNEGANRLEGGGGTDRLLGLGGADVLVGGASADLLEGGAGADLMEGRGGDDVYVLEDTDDAIVELAGGGIDYVRARASWTLNAGAEVETVSTDSHAALTAIDLTGNEFANTMIGNDGANILNGGGGADRMVGLGGADQFAFTTALGGGNVDQILDYAVGVDKIILDDAVFAGLALGALTAGAFNTGSTASDADDRILYDASTGALYFDADGAGGVAAVQFASVGAGLAITASEFTVI